MVPVSTLLATDITGVWWQYTLLFMAVSASWAGVPAIGSIALSAAAVAASQGNLDLAAVVVVSTVAGEVGGLAGYFIGVRWGREIMAKPGKHQAGRQRMMVRGEQAYAKWGRLAVFFTPAVVSGTAEMPHAQFVLWNFFASFAYTVSVALSAYGIGRLLTDHVSPFDFAVLIIGLASTVLITAVAVRRHRRRQARRLEA
jgi:membrane protein DedA with SNARE-associated domain